MRCIEKKRLISWPLGLVLVALGPACVWAQVDWAAGSGQQFSPPAANLPADTSLFPATPSVQPLDRSPRALGPTASPASNLGVVQAGYEAPLGRVAPESNHRQTSGADENVDRPAGYDGPTLRRGASPGRLPPRGEPISTAGRPGRGLNQLWATGAALALVLGLFLVVMWTVRRAAPKATLPLPSDVVETLGRAPLAGRQHVQLLRCGQKLLLVNVTSEGARTLTEITDPVEVDRLAELCRQGRPSGAAATFRQVFEQFSHSSHRGLVDERDYETGSYLDDDRASLLEGRDV